MRDYSVFFLIFRNYVLLTAQVRKIVCVCVVVCVPGVGEPVILWKVFSKCALSFNVSCGKTDIVYFETLTIFFSSGKPLPHFPFQIIPTQTLMLGSYSGSLIVS